MNESRFLPPSATDENGVLGCSEELDCRMLLDAYRHGIFPWPCEEKRVRWCSPPLRGVLELDRVHLGGRLRRELKQWDFEFRIDTACDRVIDCCAAVSRAGQSGIWLTAPLRKACKEFHRFGYVHSFEAFDREGMLAGGLYGVSLGRIFCGESMFYRVSGASKFAFVRAVGVLRAHGVALLDTQEITSATAAFGAHRISREEYLDRLAVYRGEPIVFNTGA